MVSQGLELKSVSGYITSDACRAIFVLLMKVLKLKSRNESSVTIKLFGIVQEEYWTVLGLF
jgi:hypothetical protein